MARILDRAGFDFMMLEDSSVIWDVYENSMRFQLARGGSAPKQDPMPYIPMIARAAKHLGVIATINTTSYHPYLAARLAATLDTLTNGRVGFNLVTGSGDRAAQNFGLETQIDHDQRYTMGIEWMDAVGQLLESWEPGAIVRDHENGVYADHTKVHPINFEGHYYKTRGPLATQPGPQRRITICQAGGSPAGRVMAARHADTIVTAAHGVPAMKAFREDMRQRVAAEGRDPDSIKIMYLVTPIIGETQEVAIARRDAARAAKEADIEKALFGFSGSSGVDFSKFDLDEPIPDYVLEGAQGHTSLGMTLVIIAGEIDISVGSNVALSSALLGIFVAKLGVPLVPAILIVLVVGILIGAFAGAMRAYLNVPSFIVTLALYLGLRGLGLFLTNAFPNSIPGNGFSYLGAGFLFGIPVPAIIMIVAFAVFIFIGRKTTFGRSVYAVGGNAEAARLSGLKVPQVRVLIFVLTGLLAAIVGVLLSAQLSSGNPGIGVGLEFDVIAAVIIGGSSLSGGRGTLIGTLLGVLFITVITNGLVLLGINSYLQDVVRGAIVLFAVLLSSLRNRRQAA